MNGVRFSVDGYAGKFTDVAVNATGADEVVQAAYDQLATDLRIQIGGITMHAAAWANPDHWDWDWRKEHALDEDEDVDEFIAAAILRAKEEVS